MRPKFLSLVALLSILVLGLLIGARKHTFHSSKEPGEQTKIEVQDANTGSTAVIKRTRDEPTKSALGNEQPAEKGSVLVQHQAYVEKRIEVLMDLAMTQEPSSLDTILSELTNRDPEIRKAALEATIQFGSRDAIPKLMDVVLQVDDPKEKADIIEAIEFLKLPSATEVVAQAKARGVTRKGDAARPPTSLPGALPK